MNYMRYKYYYNILYITLYSVLIGYLYYYYYNIQKYNNGVQSPMLPIPVSYIQNNTSNDTIKELQEQIDNLTAELQDAQDENAKLLEVQYDCFYHVKLNLFIMQSVEEKNERNNQLKRKIAQYEDEFEANNVRNVLGTPTGAMTPSGKEVLKIYMRNQLDLQECDLKDYEDAISAFEEKLKETEKCLEEKNSEYNSLLTVKESLEVENRSIVSKLAEVERAYRGIETSYNQEMALRQVCLLIHDMLFMIVYCIHKL